MTNIEQLAAKINDETSMKVSIRNERIYLDGRFGADITAYYQFDDATAPAQPDIFAGAALKVFPNASQTEKWLVNRAKKIKHGIMMDLLEAELIEDCCEDWEDVIL